MRKGDNMIKLGVIYGGVSTEHEVSKMSAKSVIDNLDKEKYENGGDEDGHAVQAEGQPHMVFKENTRQAGAYDKAQIIAQIGKGIGFFSLGRGGVVGVQRIVGR